MEPDAPVNQDDASDSAGFTLALSNFEGPFDLLLQLISSKKLDVTEVALSKVTDEFIAYTRMLGETADLDETTEFLVVAATLLDLKAARLLPSGEVDSEEDLALLESRDLPGCCSTRHTNKLPSCLRTGSALHRNAILVRPRWKIVLSIFFRL